MKPVPRPKLQYGNTSRSFTTANGATRALAMWLLLCLHRISANNNRLLETGVSTIARTPHIVARQRGVCARDSRTIACITAKYLQLGHAFSGARGVGHRGTIDRWGTPWPTADRAGHY